MLSSSWGPSASLVTTPGSIWFSSSNAIDSDAAGDLKPFVAIRLTQTHRCFLSDVTTKDLCIRLGHRNAGMGVPTSDLHVSPKIRFRAGLDH